MTLVCGPVYYKEFYLQLAAPARKFPALSRGYRSLEMENILPSHDNAINCYHAVTRNFQPAVSALHMVTTPDTVDLYRGMLCNTTRWNTEPCSRCLTRLLNTSLAATRLTALRSMSCNVYGDNASSLFSLQREGLLFCRSVSDLSSWTAHRRGGKMLLLGFSEIV